MTGLGIWAGGAALIIAKFGLVFGLYAAQTPTAESSDLVLAQTHVIEKQVKTGLC